MIPCEGCCEFPAVIEIPSLVGAGSRYICLECVKASKERFCTKNSAREMFR